MELYYPLGELRPHNILKPDLVTEGCIDEIIAGSLKEPVWDEYLADTPEESTGALVEATSLMDELGAVVIKNFFKEDWPSGQELPRGILNLFFHISQHSYPGRTLDYTFKNKPPDIRPHFDLNTGATILATGGDRHYRAGWYANERILNFRGDKTTQASAKFLSYEEGDVVGFTLEETDLLFIGGAALYFNGQRSSVAHSARRPLMGRSPLHMVFAI